MTKPSAADQVPQAIDVHQIPVTFFKNHAAQTKTVEHLTLWALGEKIQHTTKSSKKRLPWLKLAAFGEHRSGGNALRNNDNVIEITGIEVDYDGNGCLTFDQAVERLWDAGLRALVYTSASYEKGVKEKWRVLCPTSQPLPPDARYGLAAVLHGLLGGGIDGDASFTLSTAFYYGSVNSNPAHRVEVLDGDFIDLRPDLAAGAVGKPPKGKREATGQTQTNAPNQSPGYSEAELDAMLDRTQYKNSDGSGNWWDNMRDVIASYVGRYWGDAAILAKVMPFAYEDVNVLKFLAGARERFGIPDPDIPAGAKLGPDVLAAIAKDAPPEAVLGSTPDDYYAYLPTHQYIYRHTGRLYPLASINATLGKVTVGTKKKKQTKAQKAANEEPEVVAVHIPASLWLDRNRPVMEMSWLPGAGELIEGRLPSEGGWVDKEGVQTFNEYKPPAVGAGDASRAGRWVDLVRRIYPDHAEHIIGFFAHRVQRPAEKINHALVLTGSPGIGKDTLLEPLKHGVGARNFREVSPHDITGNNDFMKGVVLRVSETRDLGELNRYGFYELTKTMIAAPPDMVRINIKHIPQFYIPNITSVIFTTNYPADGLFLPPDDRRHYVCGTDLTRTEVWDEVCIDMWGWYQAGGLDDVVAYLRAYDLSGFSAKAPPVKTEAFWLMVETGRPVEEGEFRDAIARMGDPVALTLDGLIPHADHELVQWIRERSNARNIGRRLADCGYVPVLNLDEKSGRWKVAGSRKAIYGKKEVGMSDRFAAATELKRAADEAHKRYSDEIGKMKPKTPK